MVVAGVESRAGTPEASSFALNAHEEANSVLYLQPSSASSEPSLVAVYGPLHFVHPSESLQSVHISWYLQQGPVQYMSNDAAGGGAGGDGDGLEPVLTVLSG